MRLFLMMLHQLPQDFDIKLMEEKAMAREMTAKLAREVASPIPSYALAMRYAVLISPTLLRCDLRY